MRKQHGWLGRLVCLAAVVGFAAYPAFAFYPFGFFSPGGQGGALIYVKWPLSVLDVNGDGDVAGDDEGILLNFETGPSGYTEDQIEALFFGYEEWERVATAYIAFARGQDIPDPVELESGFANIDTLNMVALERPGDDVIVPTGFATVTLYAFITDPMVVVIDNTPILFDEPQFVEVDTVNLESAMLSSPDTIGFVEGFGTFAGGLSIGLGIGTLENIDENASAAAGRFIEQEPIALRNFQGILTPRGVTTSLFNAFYAVDLGNGAFRDGTSDLAPDDIAGVTFLYPRQESDQFFDIVGVARTRSSALLPSRPIAGAWIRAYVNANNNSGNRVPFVDTFTGLYTPPINIDGRNRFELKGLLKQMETIGGQTFQANYTLTCAEFRPVLEFDPAANIDQRENLDSTHGGFGTQGGAVPLYTGFGFDSNFPSEVFNEGGNIIGEQNLSQGTALAFDLVRREVVSTSSGLSLLQIVGPERIIFGDDGVGAGPDPNGCPLNQIITAPATLSGGNFTTPDKLRAFRDNVLLSSAIGVALTDAYYRVGPPLATFFEEHATATAIARAMLRLSDIILANPIAFLLFGMAAAAGYAARKMRRFQRMVAVASVAAFMVAIVATPAHARLLFTHLSEFVAASPDVVHGTVESAESYWTPDGRRIVTDVSIKVEEAVKGRLNKNGLIHFRLPTGQVGGIVRYSPQLPTFEAGEEVILFLEPRKNSGYSVVGGIYGKIKVKSLPSTGVKYVGAESSTHDSPIRKAAAEIRALREGGVKSDETGQAEESGEKSAEADDSPITLEEFKDYIRYLDREQRKAAR